MRSGGKVIGFGPTQLSKPGEILTTTLAAFFRIQLGFITWTTTKFFDSYLRVIFTFK